MEQDKSIGYTNEDFGRFYVVLKLDLKKNSYECIYSHDQEVYGIVRKTEDYDTFIQMYIEKFIHDADKTKVRDFLLSERLTENLVDGYAEQDIVYHRLEGENSYTKMKAKKYVDIKDNTAMITLHNVKDTYNTIMEMKRELQKKERDMTRNFWNMVSLLTTVLDHNNLSEADHQDNIIFFTKQMYLQLQKMYPEYEITDEEIEAVAHLAPIHDIGKIRVPIEILNKKGELTEEEMETVRQHPLVGAEMTKKFPKCLTTEKLNALSYEICRHHHERYDGAGYPDGLQGEEIPLCAQVVGLVDAYDALISLRPYKRKLAHEEALQMILNGECGSISRPLLRCFLEAAMQNEWIKKADG